MSVIRTNKADSRGERFMAPYTRWFSRIFGVQSEGSVGQAESSTSTKKDSMSGSRLSTSHALTSEHQTSSPESKHRPHLTTLQYSTASKTASSSISPQDVDMDNVDNVASFLSQSSSKSISAEEVEGMLAMLRENTSPEPREIFRFSSTPSRDLQSSPSTPLTTRKKLPRNPNGVYRWEGAGSAKHTRPRNRYASPAFGASPSKQAIKDSIDFEDIPDSKRRRVGDELSSSSVSTQRPSISEPTTRKVPFPSIASPTSGTNGVSNRSTPSRLRTPVKPTVPVVPSPLRQTWSETFSTSSQNETRKTPPQTKTANFMAELIKETTPPKKPDLANPYQLASPVAKVGPPRRSTKRPRATGRPVAPTKAENDQEKGRKEPKEGENLKEYSPQTIIEATLPKGSQRLRPPANFEKSTDTFITEEKSSYESPRSQREAPVVESRKITYVVEEVEEDEAEEARRYAKRTKSSINGSSPVPSAAKRIEKVASEPEITIDVLEDIVMDTAEQKGKTKEQPKLMIQINENGQSTSRTSTSPTNAISPTASRNKLSSAPKEPSKLRFSFQPEGNSVPSSPASKPTPTPFKFEPPSSDFSFTFNPTNRSPGGSPKPQEQAKRARVKSIRDEVIREKARAMRPSSLPVFVMTSSATSVLPSSAVARMHKRVSGRPVSSLPRFDLSPGPSKSATPFSFGFDPTNPKPKSFPSTFAPGRSPPKIIGNNNSPKSFGTFGVNSPLMPPVLEATVIKHSVESAVPVVKVFDFAAAGMKAPSNNPGTWVCSLCALSNPSSALKCETCDTPAISTSSAAAVAGSTAPSPPPPAVPIVKAFDFAAAGMKAPSVASGTWICSLCALSNPDSALECQTCDTPAISTTSPAAVAAPPAPSAAPAVSAIKAFDFAAAGMKAPSVASGTWLCSLCALSNPDSALECQTCDTPAISTTSPAAVAAPPAPSAAPAVPAIKAFDFAATGMKAPSVASGTWLCPFCGLANPRSVFRCKTCESLRSPFS